MIRLESKEEIEEVRREFDGASPERQRQIIFKRLYEAFVAARRGKTRTRDEAEFERDVLGRLGVLTDELIEQNYKPSRGVAFVVLMPVVREIFAAKFRDRVIHHFLYNLTAGFIDRQLIDNSYSCRVGKGTDQGIRQMYRQARKVSHNFTEEIVVFKFDILGYFMSLPHKELFAAARRLAIKQFGKDSQLGQLVIFLWRQIIFDDPIDGVTVLGRREDWAKVPPSKSLFCQPRGRGIVIGNLTS